MHVMVLGHGSLMSGLGLSSSGTFQVHEVRIVAIAGCRRGFAKLSKYGDRFATDLEIRRLPLEGRVVSPHSIPNGEVETLGLTVPLDNVCRLAKREGYQPDIVRELAVKAETRGLNLAEFLWHLDSEGGHDPVTYRQRLFALTGFTSPHYIPHPVRIAGSGYGLIYLAPGFEGTGSDAVISVRQQTGVRNIMSTAAAWQRKPNEDQIAYFLSCFLAGVHGICMRDFLASAAHVSALRTMLASRLGAEIKREATRFQDVTGLSPEQYQACFGESDTALQRSGLKDFLAQSTGKDT